MYWGADGLPQFSIALTPEAIVPSQLTSPQRNITASAECHRWIQRMIAAGQMQQCRREDLMFFTRHRDVPKAGTTERRIVGDFRDLNDITTKIAGMRIDCLEMCRKLASFKYKAKIDLSGGFYNVAAHPESYKYLGIYDGRNYFHYTCMPMGTSNSPSIFSYFMPTLLSRLPPEYHRFVANYQDDILVFGPTSQVVARAVKAVRKLLMQRNIKINERKSVMQPTTELEALGYTVGETVKVRKERKESLIKTIQHALQLEQLSKRQRARIIGKVLFISIRDENVRKQLQPLYAILQKLPDWKTELPLTSIEQQTYQQIIKWLEGGGQLSTRPTLYVDATDTDVGAYTNGRRHLWKNVLSSKDSATERELNGIHIAIT